MNEIFTSTMMRLKMSNKKTNLSVLIEAKLRKFIALRLACDNDDKIIMIVKENNIVHTKQEVTNFTDLQITQLITLHYASGIDIVNSLYKGSTYLTFKLE